MSVCAFIGHRNCSETVRPIIKKTIENLILTERVDTFSNSHKFVNKAVGKGLKVINIGKYIVDK